MDLYQNGLRLGYTTGSCAAGASLAAALLLEDDLRDNIKLMTPAGIELDLKVYDLHKEGEWAVAAIKKDAGDDEDATDGALIYSKLRKKKGPTTIDGGEGIGIITKKGLFGKIGEKAINPTPRKMILDALNLVSDDSYEVVIYVPNGNEIAKRTYNENMGIVGGISIIGSSGIVYPMSEDALLKTIELDINVNKAEYGLDKGILLVPGNYGEKMKSKYNIDMPHAQMSNFIGEALKYAYKAGYKKIYLLGHIGKFSKLSLGIFNTHSKNSDTRMEAFVYYLFMIDAPREFILKISNLNTAEEAMNICIDAGYEKAIKLMESGASDRIKKYLKDEDIEVKVMIYSMEKGLLKDN
ncbi:MAG: cobalt-precorrin-5B (C(1))-methyltransferase CbiD [Ezakiella sp.]|nr:cobalt-precorrin-5B (C(1))-methyltransferase CbiD [Ezakiella sp.]